MKANSQAIADQFMKGVCINCLAIIHKLSAEKIARILREEFRKRKEKKNEN